jgi:hypothetical protein
MTYVPKLKDVVGGKKSAHTHINDFCSLWLLFLFWHVMHKGCIWNYQFYKI